jgi:hypothetical protein
VVKPESSKSWMPTRGQGWSIALLLLILGAASVAGYWQEGVLVALGLWFLARGFLTGQVREGLYPGLILLVVGLIPIYERMSESRLSTWVGAILLAAGVVLAVVLVKTRAVSQSGEAGKNDG